MDDFTLRLLHRLNPQWELRPFPAFEGKHVDREVLPDVLRWMGERLVICLVGPRRVGKTTLLQDQLRQRLATGTPSRDTMYFPFDEVGSTGPQGLTELLDHFLEEVRTGQDGPCWVFLDEIQLVDRWQAIVKRYYDHLAPKLRFMVTGSESLEIRRASLESLAGRRADLAVGPFSFREYLALEGVSVDRFALPSEISKLVERYGRLMRERSDWPLRFREYLLRGGIPQAIEMGDLNMAQTFLREAVVEKTIFRDLSQVATIESPSSLYEAYRSISAQSAALFEVRNLSHTLGVSLPTASKMVWYLERAFLISLSYNFTRSRARQSRTAKKVYLTDTGVCAAMQSLGPEVLRQPQLLGPLAETALRNHAGRFGTPFIWRDPRQREVDIVLQRPDRSLIPIEVKQGRQERGEDLTGLRAFREKFETQLALLVSQDGEPEEVEDVWRVPAWLLALSDLGPHPTTAPPLA